MYNTLQDGMQGSREQVGWDGRPRPSSVARSEPADEWPATLPAQSDTYMGEPYLGPWE